MEKNKRILNVFIILIIIALILIIFMIISSGTSKISDIKNEEKVGKDIKVKGIVQNTLKIGNLSGYTLKDDTGTIAVSSKTLPEEGSTITVKGTLIKDIIFGYYIKSE